MNRHGSAAIAATATAFGACMGRQQACKAAEWAALHKLITLCQKTISGRCLACAQQSQCNECQLQQCTVCPTAFVHVGC